MSSAAETVTDLGRRAGKVASRRLAQASTAEKNAALLEAADVLLAGVPRFSKPTSSTSRRRKPTAWRRRRSIACASLMPDSFPWPVGCARSHRSPIQWGRPSTAAQPQRAPHHARAGAARRDRDHLREPPRRHQRRAGLCVKAGNTVLLRGSSTALRSNMAVASVLRDALAKHGLPEDAVILVEDTAYETATEVMQLTDYVDCLFRVAARRSSRASATTRPSR